MNAALLATANALSSGIGLVVLLGLGAFIAALITDHIDTIRQSLTHKENDQ